MEIAKRAMQAGKLGGFDVVMLDTAGRTNADEAMMSEMAAIETANPNETMLVADSLTGQEAVRIAAQFAARVTLTGIMLTRADGDGRGGAALSMRHETGVAIKYLGVGETIDALEVLTQRALQTVFWAWAMLSVWSRKPPPPWMRKRRKKLPRMKKGLFTLEDMAEQLHQMQRLGGMSGLLGMLPGMGKLKKQAADNSPIWAWMTGIWRDRQPLFRP